MEMNEKRSALAHMYDDDNNIYVKLHLNQSKPFKNSRKFDYESIDTRAFINGITNSALLLYNHDRSKPICRLNSERVQMTYDDKAIEFTINLSLSNSISSNSTHHEIETIFFPFFHQNILYTLY